MDWSPEQKQALAAVRAWRRSGGSRFYLGGYAGTGKTTLAKELAAEEGAVEFCAFTGKAASVLQKKGCPGARTIHSLIYVPADKSKQHLLDLADELKRIGDAHPNYAALKREYDQERERVKSPAFLKNDNSDLSLGEVDLVIVDEVSMVDDRMGKDLMSFGVPVLVLGDPAQLPPVGSSQGYFTRSEPDFMLEEIHRQAADSPVLQLATRVRQGESSLPLGEWGDSRVVPKRGVKPEEALTYDQIICGRNKTRHAINQRLREELGREGLLPVPGDKLVCLRNHGGFLNGTFWEVLESKILDDTRLELVVCDPEDPHRLGSVVTAWRHHFEHPYEDLPLHCALDKEVHQFDYGYAITCHKAQGSQWDRVLIYDESWIARADRRKWLYTAITRASESVTIVQG